MEQDDGFLKNKYHLSELPFTRDTGSKDLVPTWVNQDEEVKKWKAIVDSLSNPQKNYLAVIIGQYGRGKTQALWKVASMAEEAGKVLVIYKDFRKGQAVKDPELDFIFELIRGIPFDELSKSKTTIKAAIEKLPDSLEESRTILNKLYFGTSAQKKLALYFIKGQIKPNKTQLEELEVLRKLDDSSILKEYFAAILRFLKELGFSSICFCLDEFESLFGLVPKSQRPSYIGILRSLYDFPGGSVTGDIGEITRIAIFIAVSEDGWTRLKEMEQEEKSTGGPIQPFIRRIDAVGSLKALTKDDTTKLIEARLKFDRPTKKYRSDYIIPFKKDFVEFVFEESNGEPHLIVGICDDVLKAGLKNKIEILDRKFAEQVLKKT